MSADEQNTNSPLLDVILQIGEELEKTTQLCNQVVVNFNKYNQEELTNMLINSKICWKELYLKQKRDVLDVLYSENQGGRVERNYHVMKT